jgi:hypothetical protein
LVEVDGEDDWQDTDSIDWLTSDCGVSLVFTEFCESSEDEVLKRGLGDCVFSTEAVAAQ